jgi:hypothetical protein
MISRRTLGVLIASVTTAASLSAQSVRVADSLLRAGDFRGAENMYYAASRVRPRDPDARYALGKYLLDRGAFRIGATLIDEAMQFGYDRRAGSAVLARAYMNLGEYEAIDRLPVATLSSDEQAQVRWLAARPSRLSLPDSSVLVAFNRTGASGYIGAVRLRVNGQPIVALVSTRSTCGLRVSDTLSVARSLHRFGAAGRGGYGLLAAADSLGVGRLSISNVPVVIERMSVPAVICFGMLARYAPSFDPRGNLMTLHMAGVAPPPSSRAMVAPIMDVGGEYTVLHGGKWTPIVLPEVAALLRDRRWTFDPRRRQVAIEP